MSKMTIQITQAEDAADIPLPHYQTTGAAGADIHAAVTDDVVIEPGQVKLIPTGLSVALPSDLEAQIRPRSGLAVKSAVTVVNAPGTIDSDYRGEIKVGLINLGDSAFTITRGMRIAQMVIAPVVQAVFEKTDHLEETQRGAAGFGSTGT
jgi:dUTP pyrophosphatase